MKRVNMKRVNMKRFILWLFFVVLFSPFFFGCFEDERIESMDETAGSNYLIDDTEKYVLTVGQLQDIFKATMSFRIEKVTQLAKDLQKFLSIPECRYYRRIVYEIYQEIKMQKRRLLIKVDPNDSDLKNNPQVLARYDSENETVVYRKLETEVLGGELDGVTLIHEMIHHWQNLLKGKDVFRYENLRNTEFEVIFLLDMVICQLREGNIDNADDLLQYLYVKDFNNQYTKEQIDEYKEVLWKIWHKEFYLVRDKLQTLAKNYKTYDHVGYNPYLNFRLIDFLWSN